VGLLRGSTPGEEDVMDAPSGTEALTTRIGAIALPLGIILHVVAKAFHPSLEDAMDNRAVFMEYAQSNSWVAGHFAQWFAVLLLLGGLGALYYSITTKSELGAAVARFGLGAVVLTAASYTMLQAVDGVALKWAVDAWASAPAHHEAAAFAAAEALRWTEYGIQSLFTILLALALVLYGLAMVLGTVYPRWLGWVAMGSGVAWIAHGLRVPYIGLFLSIAAVVATVLLFSWTFIMAFLMWRNSNRGRIVRLDESASTGPAQPPASPR
jgi:uncharacterized MnhB-related membrane protein